MRVVRQAASRVFSCGHPLVASVSTGWFSSLYVALVDVIAVYVIQFYLMT